MHLRTRLIVTFLASNQTFTSPEIPSYSISPADRDIGEEICGSTAMNNTSSRHPNGSCRDGAEQLAWHNMAWAKTNLWLQVFLHPVGIRSRVSITSIAVFWPLCKWHHLV